MEPPRPPRASLAEMLAVRSDPNGRISVRLESFWGTAVPGDLLGRATLAASAGRSAGPSATHTVVLRPIPPDVDLTLLPDELSPQHVRVTVCDADARVAEVLLRFGPPGDGPVVHGIAPEPGLPSPEELPSEAELAAREGWAPYAVGPVESRRVTPPEPVKDREPAVWLGWLRPRESLGDEPLVHAAALAFVAEYRSHWAVERRLGADFPSTEIELLDHALWVHQPRRWDDWWLVRTVSEVATAGRCLSRREIHARDGALIASAAWEAALRPAPTPAR